MNTIAYCEEYNKNFTGLNEEERFHLEKLQSEIKYNRLTPASHREAIKILSGEKVYTFRVNRDIRLAAYLWRPKEYMFLACGHHDWLYNRLGRMKLEKVRECELPKQVIVETVIETVRITQTQQEESSQWINPFASLSDEQLSEIGISYDTGVQFRECETQEACFAVIDSSVEGECLRSGLLDFCFGQSDFASVKNKVIAAPVEHRRPIREVLKNSPADRENYFVLTEDTKQYEEFINGRLENWQVFLHPSQDDAVRMVANGPAMITGAAGTGKTVVAAHRVKWLLENQFIHGERILFTTYVVTLVDSVKAMLSKLCTPEQLARVDVINLDAVLRDEWRKFRPGVGILLDNQKEVRQLLDLLIDKQHMYSGKRTREFLVKEYEKVILEHNIHTLEEYKKVERSRLLGRVDREKERAELWPLFEMLNRFFETYTDNNQCRSGALNQLAGAIKCAAYVPKKDYAAVIVDEAQDFGAPEYRFLAAFTGNSYERPIPYSLYICGDGHQRVYGRSGSLKECGINVPGSRSRKLRVCYRTTRKIREYAEEIIRNVSVKDMNGDAESIVDMSSIEEGVPPEKRFSRDYPEMNRIMASSFNAWHNAGVAYSDMAVFMRNAGRYKNDERYLYNTMKALRELGVPADMVTRRQHNLGGDSVKVMTMHRAKGLQFYGVVINLDNWPFRDKEITDAEQVSAKLDEEKCLLYMAIMRATSRVVLTGTRGEPKELPAVDVASRNNVKSAPCGKSVNSPPVNQHVNEKENATPSMKTEQVINGISRVDSLEVTAYKEFKRRLPSMSKEGFQKLKDYEKKAVQYLEAKNRDDKRGWIVYGGDLKNARELMLQWDKFALSRKIKFGLIDAVCAYINEGGNEVAHTDCEIASVETTVTQRAPKVPCKKNLVKCPHCSAMVRESRLYDHMRKAHSFKRTSLRPPKDPEDIQREIYGG